MHHRIIIVSIAVIILFYGIVAEIILTYAKAFAEYLNPIRYLFMRCAQHIKVIVHALLYGIFEQAVKLHLVGGAYLPSITVKLVGADNNIHLFAA